MKTPSFWQTRTWCSFLLLPISWLYGLGARLDRARQTAAEAPIAVLSLGNATAGGTGKTPATMALAQLLSEMGHTPHILTRGYGGAPQQAHRVTPQDDWRQVGDEALLLAQAAPTWVGADRLASARAAAAAGASLALCDDAHQHHRLKKNLSFLVIDGPYGLGNQRLIPSGPLREPLPDALARADAVILIGDDAQQLTHRIALPIFRAQLAPRADIAPLRQKKWLAFAGIGRPSKFFDTLHSLGVPLLATRSFADHHVYSQAEITALSREAEALGAELLTTEKDAVKLRAVHGASITTLPVTLTFEDPHALTGFLRTRLA